jgi:hypothetical protein
MVTDGEAQEIARKVSESVARQSREMYDSAMAQIEAGTPIDVAIEAAQRQFVGQYATAIAEAFNTLLQLSVTSAQILQMPVGDVTLSESLYANARQASAEVKVLLEQHARGMQSVRALALALYDGYAAAGAAGRPLEWVSKAELPQPVKALLAADRSSDLAGLLDEAKAAAAQPKTAALRAAYVELINAWEAGAGADIIERKTRVALAEKTRQYADRIARTELALAHGRQRARDVMGDDALQAVRIMLNPAHPTPDICDLHAGVDLYGLGAGVYPKALAPTPAYHPHCWCRVKSMYSVAVPDGVKADPQAVTRYLSGLAPSVARRVAGSGLRLTELMAAERHMDVINHGKPDAYLTVPVGEAAKVALIPGVTPPASAA